MTRETLLFVLVAGALVTTPGVAVPGAEPASSRYELTEESSYAQGCVAPCLCPIRLIPGMRGAFRLTSVGFNGLFQEYGVSEVAWTVPLVPPLEITGSGTYRVGGEFAAMHRLELDLTMSDGRAQHFDSGMVLGGAEFPDINITASMNMGCFDTILAVHAKATEVSEPLFVRGDCNGDEQFDISDAVRLLLSLFVGSGPLGCQDACDGNDDGGLDLADAVYLLSTLFTGGPSPPHPHPECGKDPGPLSLGCESFSGCP